MSKKITAIVIGAGMRGMGYSNTAKKMPEEYEIVAVADPVECRREYVKEQWGIPADRCFTHYEEILALGKIADAAFICTMDRDHFAPTMKAIELGYDIMLEKPIAPTPEECAAITKAANEKGVKVLYSLFAVGFLYVACRCIPVNAKHFIVVSFCHILMLFAHSNFCVAYYFIV